MLRRSTLLAPRLRPAARFSNYRLRALSSKKDEPQTTKPADGAPSTEAYDKDGKPLPSIPGHDAIQAVKSGADARPAQECLLDGRLQRDRLFRHLHDMDRVA